MKLTLMLMGGSAFLLIGILGIYFGSGATTMNLLEIAQLHNIPFAQQCIWFPLTFLGFGVLGALFPFHTWSPDGHASAPTAVSMLHAGVLMKLGGYGCFRIAMYLMPEAAQELGWIFLILTGISVVYGAFSACVQTDLKYINAYSSVSHCGLVLFAILMMNQTACTGAVNLIDEYDSPFNSTYDKKSHEKILKFLRSMLYDALKGNDSLGFAVITEVMQISKENIFSGLDNIFVNNIFSTASDEMFGFTSYEVRKLCSDYGYPEKYEETRQWYDGYVFGNTEIYNPWSVLNYVKCGFRPDEYWAGTSGNSIIPILLNKADKTVFEDLKILGEGGSITHIIDTKISYADMTDIDGIYSVMAL